MSVNTDFTSTSGSSAAAATVIKRGAPGADAPRVFRLAEDSAKQKEAKPVAREGQMEPVLSDSEKQYFEGLFPNSASAIRSYSPYQRNGAAQTASIGTLVDVKG